MAKRLPKQIATSDCERSVWSIKILLRPGGFASVLPSSRLCANMDLNCHNFAEIEQTDLVLFKSSPIHGIGGFAKKPIEPRMRILEYKGELITKRESLLRCEQNNPFIFSLDDQQDLDGNVEENQARFIESPALADRRLVEVEIIGHFSPSFASSSSKIL